MASGIGLAMESTNVLACVSLFMVEEPMVCPTTVAGTDSGCILLASNLVVQTAEEDFVNVLIIIN